MTPTSEAEAALREMYRRAKCYDNVRLYVTQQLGEVSEDFKKKPELWLMLKNLDAMLCEGFLE
jgi:hypothetical protein